MLEITYNGVTMNAADWARNLGKYGLPEISEATITRRKRAGWSDENTLTTPPFTKQQAAYRAKAKSPWSRAPHVINRRSW